MKLLKVSMIITIGYLALTSSVLAKDCTPPSDGMVSFTFQADGNTCTFEKKIIKTIKAGGFDYSSGGATANNYYYQANYGCDSSGNWGVNKDNPLKCEPLENCLAESNIDFSLVENKESGKVHCKVSTGAVPKLNSGEEFQFQHGLVRCFHRQLRFKPSSYPFTCPAGTILNEDEVAAIESGSSSQRCESKKDLVFYAKDRDGNNCEIKHASLPPLNNGNIVSSDGTPGRVKCNNGKYEVDSAVKFSCPSDSIVADNYTGEKEEDNEPGEGTDGKSTNLLAEGYGANDQITAAAAAFGAGMSEKCEAGAKVKSFNTYTSAFKAYHSLVLANVDIHEKGLLRMEQRAKELVEQTKNNQSLKVQVESLNFQRDSFQLMIDLYMNNKTGTYKGKIDLLAKISDAQKESINEFNAMNKSMLVCNGQTASALEIARTGCERTKLVETCNEDGTECEETVEADPVEGSCLALEMIPQSLNIKEELYNIQFEVMPSNLLVTGQENITKNYIRYVTSSIPQGEWQAPLVSCGEVLDKTHINYGVKCETPQGDLANAQEWGVPVEGRLVSDLFAGILGRLPDTGGDDYWQKEYDRIVASGKTAEEATAEIRHHISMSNENRGIPDTEEEIQRRLDSNTERGIVSVPCEDATCGRSEVAKKSVDADKWYSSIEEQARFKDLVNSESEELSVNDLKTLSFDKFEKGDLLVGSPHGRMQLTPQMNELITQSIIEDLKVVEELQKNRDEIITMLNNVKVESGTSVGNTGGSSPTLSTGTSATASLSKIEQTTQALSPIDTDSLLKSVADASAISDELNNKTDGALKKFEPPKSLDNKSKDLLAKIKLSNKAASRGSFNGNTSALTTNTTTKTGSNKRYAIDQIKNSLGLESSTPNRRARSQNRVNSNNTNSESEQSIASNEAATNSDSSFSSGLTPVDFSGFEENSVIPTHDRDRVNKAKRVSRNRRSVSGRMPASSSRLGRKSSKSSNTDGEESSKYIIERGNTYSIDSSIEINKADTSLFKIISKRYSNTKLYPKK